MKKQLVVEHIEKINKELLEKYQSRIRNYSKGRNGIYVLYKGDSLYYIGLATSLSGRLSVHLKNRHKNQWDKFSMYLTADDSYLKEMESFLIRILKPKGNTQNGKLKNSYDLSKDLKKDLEHQFKIELAYLTGLRNDKKISLSRGKLKKGQTDLVQLGLYSRPLRAKYKGKTIKARLDKDGWIVLRGKKYPSPSAAGYAVIKRACNGWSFWSAKKDGQWKKLTSFR